MKASSGLSKQVAIKSCDYNIARPYRRAPESLVGSATQTQAPPKSINIIALISCGNSPYSGSEMPHNASSAQFQNEVKPALAVGLKEQFWPHRQEWALGRPSSCQKRSVDHGGRERVYLEMKTETGRIGVACYPMKINEGPVILPPSSLPRVGVFPDSMFVTEIFTSLDDL